MSIVDKATLASFSTNNFFFIFFFCGWALCEGYVKCLESLNISEY